MPTITNGQSTATDDAVVYDGHDESDYGIEDGHAHNAKHGTECTQGVNPDPVRISDKGDDGGRIFLERKKQAIQAPIDQKNCTENDVKKT